MFFHFFFAPLLLCGSVMAQPVNQKLQAAVSKLSADSQMQYAQLGLYVVDAVTGEVICNKNGFTGLASASCLKLVTSATAFEKLGKSFRFTTTIGGDGRLENGVYEGNLYISGTGDPSLGSWRWAATRPDTVLRRITAIVKAAGIKKITGNLFIDDYQGGFHHVTPGGWTWDDLGNYYGAPARQFNWHENQFDIWFKTGANAGMPVAINRLEPELPGVTLSNYLKTAAKGTGDKSVIYLPPFSATGYITGTLPAGENAFKVSGAIPNPAAAFGALLTRQLQQQGIELKGKPVSMLEWRSGGQPVQAYTVQMGTIESPPLDSLNYWFMKKSINLYGEAIIKAQDAPQQLPLMETAEAVKKMQQFWKAQSIAPGELNIYDGSGLSPQNRVTPHALVTVLQYARKQPWYSDYYNAFPEYNGMKLKSGTIADVKGFAGYHTAKNGRQYIIAFLINNFSGPSSGIVRKMYNVLDVLK